MKANLMNTFSHPLLSLCYAVMLVLAFSNGVRAQGQESNTAPRVWEAPLSIPTYELGPPNPYPALLDWQRRKVATGLPIPVPRCVN